MIAPDFSDRSIAELLRLTDRTAVITGGAAGLGLGIAHRLAEAGANVVIADIKGAGPAAAAVAEASGAATLGVDMDVTDSASVSAGADAALERFGRLDIWVNNAGIYPTGAVLDLTDDDWDRVLGVNLRGSFIGAREAGRRMVAAGRGGVILNMVSIAAFRAAGSGIAHYIASKHGLSGLTKSLAVELGPEGIRVLAIAPAMIQTPGMAEAGDEMRAANADLFDSFAARMPLRRLGVVDDVARVALFGVSDMAAFMTGSTLAVDAGDLAQ